MLPATFENIYHVAVDVFKLLKHEWPEYVVDLILMTMLRNDGNPLGQCNLAAEGVPLFKSVPESVIKGVLRTWTRARR